MKCSVKICNKEAVEQVARQYYCEGHAETAFFDLHRFDDEKEYETESEDE